MKKKIRVTREDIGRGGTGSRHCPITRALRREIGRGWMAGTWCAWNPDTGDPVTFPRSAQRFVASYDAGKSVRPFTFTIDLPAPERKSGS